VAIHSRPGGLRTIQTARSQAGTGLEMDAIVKLSISAAVISLSALCYSIWQGIELVFAERTLVVESSMDALPLGVATGVATAAVLGLIGLGWRQYRESRVGQLGDLMGEIIKHRNTGRHKVPVPAEWVIKAKAFEQQAEEQAFKVSRASGILIRSLGELKRMSVDRNVTDPQQIKYVNLLTTVISRIRDTLGRHDH